MDYWLQLSIEKNIKMDMEEKSITPKNWLQNNSPLLLDIPAEQFSPNLKKSTTFVTNTFEFGYTPHGFIIKTENGHELIHTGDTIETDSHLITIQINKSKKTRGNDPSIFESHLLFHDESTPASKMAFENPIAFLYENTQVTESNLFSTLLNEEKFLYSDMKNENSIPISFSDSPLEKNENRESFLQKLKLKLWG